eukprot:7088853-Alexandrium_andersonii.AAC.1
MREHCGRQSADVATWSWHSMSSRLDGWVGPARPLRGHFGYRQGRTHLLILYSMLGPHGPVPRTGGVQSPCLEPHGTAPSSPVGPSDR